MSDSPPDGNGTSEPDSALIKWRKQRTKFAEPRKGADLATAPESSPNMGASASDSLGSRRSSQYFLRTVPAPHSNRLCYFQDFDTPTRHGLLEGEKFTIILSVKEVMVEGQVIAQAEEVFRGLSKDLLTVMSMHVRRKVRDNPDATSVRLSGEAGSAESLRHVLKWLHKAASCTNPYMLPIEDGTLNIGLYQTVDFLDIPDARKALEDPIFEYIADYKGVIGYDLFDEMGSHLGPDHQVLGYLVRKLGTAIDEDRRKKIERDPEWVSFLEARPLLKAAMSKYISARRSLRASENRRPSAQVARGGQPDRANATFLPPPRGILREDQVDAVMRRA